MTPAELIEEAHRLARPCLRLSAVQQRGTPVAWWGAHRTLARDVDLRHELTMDLAAVDGSRFGLPESGRARLFLDAPKLHAEFEVQPVSPTMDHLPTSESFWEDVYNPWSGEFIGRKLKWKEPESRVIPLWGVEDVSLPSIDDLFQCGSPSIVDWIRSVGWQPEWGYNSNFGDKETSEAYEQHYFDHMWRNDDRTSLSLAKDKTFATLGGWCFALDGEGCPDGDLVLTAYACSEPQVEVWRVGSEYQLVTRIT